MKAFVNWMVAAVVGFGALSGASHWYLTDHPLRTLVIVDSSFPMKSDWAKVPGALSELGDLGAPYARYSLFTEKGRVHGWQPKLRSGRITPYAPRDFSKLEAAAGGVEFAEADNVVLVTNASASETSGLGDWRIVRID